MDRQQLLQMLSGSPSSILMSNISTEQIQKCLEENKQLILFIMESQRLGRHNEREMLTDQLQRNLTLLSKLADAMTQPPLPPPLPTPPQMIIDQSKQQGHWLCTPEAAQVNVPWLARQPQVQLNDEHQQPYYLHQQYFPEPQKGLDPSQSIDTQLGLKFGAGNGTSHNMFYVMGNNQDD